MDEAAEAAGGGTTASTTASSPAAQVAEFLYNETVYDVGEEGRAMLLQGLREGVMAVAALPTEFFTQLKDHMASMIQVSYTYQRWQSSSQTHVLHDS